MPAVCWSPLAAQVSSRRSLGLLEPSTPAEPRRSFTDRVRSSKQKSFNPIIRFSLATLRKLFRCDMQTDLCFRYPRLTAAVSLGYLKQRSVCISHRNSFLRVAKENRMIGLKDFCFDDRTRSVKLRR